MHSGGMPAQQIPLCVRVGSVVAQAHGAPHVGIGAPVRRVHRAVAKHALAALKMAMPPQFVHNADMQFLPAAEPLIEVVCQAARWARLGAQGALVEASQDIDDMLNSEDVSLAVLGAHAHRRSVHAHSSTVRCMLIMVGSGRGAQQASGGGSLAEACDR